jgi:hypothetical protein
MLPSDLKAEQFAGYPPKARKLVLAHLGTLQQLPLGFVPSLLRELIDYDFKFPAERTSIDHELDTLSSLSPAQLKEWFQPFSQLSLSEKLEGLDWVNQPAQFVEQLSAYLWTTHQLNAFREAAIAHGNRTRIVPSAESTAIPPLGIAVIGQGVQSYDEPLFRNLRKHGTYFKRVKPDNGVELLMAAVEARAKTHPIPYGHWYVDGGLPADHSPALTSVSFHKMEPVRAALLKNIQIEIAKPGMGPEELRTHMARLSPADLGIAGKGDEVMNRFEVKLLTEGSGTQIFSTTFAQWTAREILRRAQPHTLLVRFAPRQRQRPMNELMAGGDSNPELDPTGSLIDADMGAYYQWINQQRLPGSERSSFLVWFEGHSQALAIGPSLPRGTESNSALDLQQLLSLAAG